MVEIRFDRLTPTQGRRLADIADALTEGGVEVEALVDARRYEEVPRCDKCSHYLEAGYCYRCDPVNGYRGED